jgi:single-strand DNA-binding protein
MFETTVTVVGNVITEPQVRETSGGRVASFRVVGTSRRFDRSTERWVDGDRFFATVNCWKRVADGVTNAVHKGDPVVVTGRLRTREYETGGQWRSATEIEATAVGLDLARTTTAPRGEPIPGGYPSPLDHGAVAASAGGG